MMQYRGGGGVSGRGAAARGASGGLGTDVDKLRKATDLALRQIKKLRKFELEQVCKAANLGYSGLKASLISRIESYLGAQFSAVERAAPGGALQAEALTRVTDQISRGFSDVLHKRPVYGAYSHHSTMKQDGGQRAAGGGSAGYSRNGGTGQYHWDEEAARDVLRRARLDPFVDVTDTLTGPTRLERRPGATDGVSLHFDLSPSALQAVRTSFSHGKSTDEGRKTHVLLRSYKLPKANSSRAGDQDLELGGHLWPLESMCQVNGAYHQLKQRKVFYQGTTRKLKGDCSPQDIGMSCREGQNRVELLSADQESHAVVVQTVRLVGVDEVLRDIKQRSQLTKEEALRRVKRSFKGLDLNALTDDSGGEDQGAGDSDDELMATATRLSMRCPLGLVPITCPGRGRECRHLQCFDLSTFLNFNKDCAGAAWKCGVCNLPLKPSDLVVDTYLDEVVRSLGEQGLTDDAAEVEIHNDGHWDPILEDQRAGKGRRDRKKMQPPASVQSGGAPGAPSAGVNVENGAEGGMSAGGNGNVVSLGGSEDSAILSGGDSGTNGGNGTAAAATTSAGAAQSGSSAASIAPTATAPEHEVLDLSLESDDDDADTLAPATAMGGSGAAVANTIANVPPHLVANGRAGVGNGIVGVGDVGGGLGGPSSSVMRFPNFNPLDLGGRNSGRSGGGGGDGNALIGGAGGASNGRMSLPPPRRHTGPSRSPSMESSDGSSADAIGNGRSAVVVANGVTDATSLPPGSRYQGAGTQASSGHSGALSGDGGGPRDMGGRSLDWSGSGGVPSGGGWNNSLVTFTSGQPHAVAAGAGGGAAAGGVPPSPSSSLSWQGANLSGRRYEQQQQQQQSPGGVNGGAGGARGAPQRGSVSSAASSAPGASNLVSEPAPAAQSLTAGGASASATAGSAGIWNLSSAWDSGARKEASAASSSTDRPGGGWSSGGGAAHSLKRPRPSSHPDDGQRNARGGAAAGRGRGRGRGGAAAGGRSSSNNSSSGGMNGMPEIPFYENMFGLRAGGRDASKDQGNGDDRGDGGSGGGGGGSNNAGFWQRSASSGGGFGDSGPGGVSAAGTGGTGAGSGGGGSARAATEVGWDDEVFRHLDGLGDPIG